MAQKSVDKEVLNERLRESQKNYQMRDHKRYGSRNA